MVTPFMGNIGLSIPEGTQRPEHVLLWFYFSQDVTDHNITKIGDIRFLTYFVSAMTDIHFKSGNMDKIS